ncbi:MAG TPA: FecR family protein [Polyangiales bacterium]|nr:FecR family protein [Polyangiales bacterium]
MSLERLGQELAREQDALRARSRDRAEVREQLAEQRARPPGRNPQRRWAGAALGAALAAAAVVALWPRVSRDGRVPAAGVPLAALLEGSQQAVTAGAFVEAPASQALAVRFSDGTRLRLSAGARVRLVALDASGAHVLLESGRLHVEVVPKAHARWRMSAGPFVVRVTGTRFDLSWAPEQDRFELDLASGQVEVGGCVFGPGYRMRAGQRIHASCKLGQFEVAEQRAGGERVEHGSAPPASAHAETAVPAAPSDAPAAASPDAKSEHREQAATAVPAVAADSPRASKNKRGEAAVQAQPEPERAAQRAFEQRCERANSEQLVQLAEAARFAGELEREELAWRLLRRRFAGTSRAALAAFALGRLAFDVRGEHRKAAEWFGTYLKEQPAGLLAREARGRLIEATVAAGDATRARALAQAYLREHPDGPHADLARRAAGEP